MNSQDHDFRTLKVGAIVADYRIEGVLGQGAFGITYLATDVNLQIKVAIKEFFPREFAQREGSRTVRHGGTREDKDFFSWGLERFLSEARILARLDHPNIVAVRRLLEENGTAYLVMDFCEGLSLEQLISSSGTLDAAALESLLWPMLDALDHVHRAGLIHRDIKPANIFVRADGSPVLLDFGAARFDISHHSKSVTSLATAGYAPLEQYDTRGSQGPWSDIYGLAATLYKALTGVKPPDAAGRALRDTLVPISNRLAGRLSPAILSAIESGLEVMPDRRPQSVALWRRQFGQSVGAKTQSTGRAVENTIQRDHTPLVQSAPAPIPRAPNKKGQPLPVFWIGLAVIAGLMLTFTMVKKDASEETAGPSEVKPLSVATNKSDAGTAQLKPDSKALPKISPPSNGGNVQIPKSAEIKDTKCSAEVPNEQWNDCTGTWLRADGSKYTGGFKSGRYHGHGTLDGGDKHRGDKYVGEFRSGVYHGKGRYTFANGQTYDGSWVAGKPEGRGTTIFPSGDRYVGEFHKGKRHGKGTYYYVDGSRYVGDYRDGKRHGTGTEIYVSGDKYVGGWLDGVKSGFGTYTFPSGAKYSGDHRNGKQNGIGTYTFPDGSTYVGEWKDGKYHGRGRLTYADGRPAKEGVWENDKFVGSETVPDLIAGRSGSAPGETLPKGMTQPLPSVAPTGSDIQSLRECKQLARDAMVQVGWPAKVDDVTYGHEIGCKYTSSGLYFYYFYTLTGPTWTDLTIKYMQGVQPDILKKKWCSSDELKPLLYIANVEHVYAKSVGDRPVLTVRIRKEDCKQ